MAILWANTVLKQHGTVFAKVRPNLKFEACMELHISTISIVQHLFPPELITKAGEKSSRALHDEAIRKVVTFDKHLQASSHPKSQPHRSWPHTSFVKHQDDSQSTKVLSSRKRLAAKSSQTPVRRGKRKKF